MTETVVIAPDKFKGTLTAAQVAAHLAAGIAAARPDLRVLSVPVADGGDGTVDAAIAAGYRRVEIGVRGPTGRVVNAAFAIEAGTAIIEAAQACGLARLPDGVPAPLTAGSRGVGELIAAAVRMRAKRIVLGLGGVATTDGGAGLVRALGGIAYNADYEEIRAGGGPLRAVAHLDRSGFRDLSGAEFVVATDVDNPLLGPSGAAAVYGPQKGASPEDVSALEEGLTRWADLVDPSSSLRDVPGAGAAGGLGFAAMAFLGARVEPGISLMLELLSFSDHLADARLVITGEGKLDEQTLYGKAPAGVARAAAARGVPVVAVAGVSTLGDADLAAIGIDRAYPLTAIEPDPAACLAAPGPLLESLATQIAADYLPA
jgi:glycerate 2-kinase